MNKRVRGAACLLFGMNCELGIEPPQKGPLVVLVGCVDAKGVEALGCPRCPDRTRCKLVDALHELNNGYSRPVGISYVYGSAICQKVRFVV